MTLQNKCHNENGLSKWFILISINNNDNLHDCVNTLVVVHILNCFARMGTTRVCKGKRCCFRPFGSLFPGGALQARRQEIRRRPSALQRSHGLPAGTCQDRKGLRGPADRLVQEVEAAHREGSDFRIRVVHRVSGSVGGFT